MSLKDMCGYIYQSINVGIMKWNLKYPFKYFDNYNGY